VRTHFRKVRGTLEKGCNVSILKYKWLVYCSSLFFLVGVVCSVRLGRRKQHLEKEYLHAIETFKRWNRAYLDRPMESQQELKTLEQALQKHPELRDHYDGNIGQRLLIMDETDSARHYVQRNLKKTSQPYYSSFAKSSLTVSEGKYVQALREALFLRQEMMSDESLVHKMEAKYGYGSILFGLNLLRIALLYEKLEDRENELNAWQEFKHYGGWEEKGEKKDGLDPHPPSIKHRGAQTLLSHFSIEEDSLLDYIRSRERTLEESQQR